MDSSKLQYPPPSAVSRQWSLKGSFVLVTGGTQGIGRAIVEELADLGASIYVYARRLGNLTECLQAWRDAGWSVYGSVCDVTSRAARVQLMQDVSHHFGGKLDVLVNNLGIAPVKPSVDITEEDFEMIMATHFEAAYHLSELARPLLKASGKGKVVFISSVAGFVPVAIPCNLYDATKDAMTQLTASLAPKWITDGIRVNGVAPGIVISHDHNTTDEAGDQKTITEDTGSRRLRRKQRKLHAAINGPGATNPSSGSVAATVAFLSMPCASFCTGQILAVDGGAMAPPSIHFTPRDEKLVPRPSSDAPIDPSKACTHATVVTTTVERLTLELEESKAQLEQERTRCRIAEHRAEHFYQQCKQVMRRGGVRVEPYIALYPQPTSEVMGRPALPSTAPAFIRDQSCSVCQLELDATGCFVLGCGHLFHLDCITRQLAHRSRCPLCRYEVHISVYRVLGMDDLYPGSIDMDPLTGRPMSYTTREDLMMIAAEEGYMDIPEGIEEPVVLECQEDDFEEDVISHVLEESRKDAFERTGGAGPSTQVDDKEQHIMDVEQATRVEWEARVGADFHIWSMRQARLRRVRELEAKRAMHMVHTGRLPIPQVLPQSTSIVSRVLDVPRQRRRLMDIDHPSSSDSG